jgi:hypothetical protein
VSLLAVAAVALAASAPVHSETASLGAVRATVSYVELNGDRGTWYTRLVIDREGVKAYDARVVPYSRLASWKEPTGALGAGIRTLKLRDLDGDGEPEILLDFWIGGAHCCEWTRIYRWDRAQRTYDDVAHWWGDPTYRLVPLAGRPAFVTRDDRFAYAFASFAGSGMPIRVWSYRQGRLVDITDRELALVRRDAKFWWRWYVRRVEARVKRAGFWPPGRPMSVSFIVAQQHFSGLVRTRRCLRIRGRRPTARHSSTA